MPSKWDITSETSSISRSSSIFHSGISLPSPTNMAISISISRSLVLKIALIFKMSLYILMNSSDASLHFFGNVSKSNLLSIARSSKLSIFRKSTSSLFNNSTNSSGKLYSLNRNGKSSPISIFSNNSLFSLRIAFDASNSLAPFSSLFCFRTVRNPFFIKCVSSLLR